MKFTKMHGTGNDYIYVYNEEGVDFRELAPVLSHRQKGIGSDGIIHIRTEDGFHMEMYNADGSVGAMCGNGIRCVGKFLYDHGYTDQTSLTIETKAGPRQLQLHLNPDNQVDTVTVNMGKASGQEDLELELNGKTVRGTVLSMGNPHFVIMCHNPQDIALEVLGKALETHPHFAPDGVNVEFYSPTEEGFSMRVWERGSGETLACGTGACACFAVGQRKGILDSGALTAQLLGGELSLWQEGDEIQMRGEAVTVYHGEL